MTKVLLIGSGGFLGSVLRYLLGTYLHTIIRGGSFPYGTLAANVLGRFIIGSLPHVVNSRSLFSAQARGFIFVGMLGGLTTFSAFGHDSVDFMFQGGKVLAVANIIANVGLSLTAVWIGRLLAASICR